MTGRRRSPGWGLMLLLAVLSVPSRAAAEEEARIIQLPPIVVMEAAKTPPWYYLRTASGEYLSRCSPANTREFIQADLKQFQLLATFVPERFHARGDIASLVVLDRLDQKVASESLVQDMTRLATERLTAQREADPLAAGSPGERIETLLNLRIDDRDMNVLFAYLDEKKFEGSRMVLTPGYLRFLLERRQPDLPSWFIEGAVAIFDQASFLNEPITIRPFIWLSGQETRALLRDPEWPRALLPMEELLAPDVLREEGDRAPARIAVWRAQTALFFRWAVDPKNGVRDSFWRLVEQSTIEPVTETAFQECFGFGFSEMRDRLSDYLATAVKDSVHIDPGSLDRIRVEEPKLANKELVARLLGEWQRVEIFYVAARHAQFTDRFAQEARRTLRKAYDAGDRDPQLLAALGLCEIDAGNPDGAPFFLKLALEAKVVRPRAYFEVAKMRFNDLTRNQPATYLLSPTEVESVIGPLRVSLQQKPLLPEAVALFANTWLRSAGVAPDGDFALLAFAAKTFPARPTLLFRLAAVHARFGRFAAARQLLAQMQRFPLDEQLRSRMAELQTAMARLSK